MWKYDAPIRDMRFAIETVLDAPASWRTIPEFQQLDMASIEEILSAAGRFAADVLTPINSNGDCEGCSLEPSGVKTPRGFREAYRAYIDAGWPTLACDTDVGGQGLPLLIQAAVHEMLAASNHAWSMYPGLAHGAYECLKEHAEPTLLEHYLPKIVSGEWLAAMALSEPQAGSDLSLIRTQAKYAADGSLRITGGKIFISGGDHDLTDNIVHLVLCRLPDAPAGTKGLSLALIPKVLPDGNANAMRCIGLEEKMGIHGSATCAIQYESATGWLIGEAHRGLAAMFVMMNAARLHVGLQGLGHLEMATQNAVRYARERSQMRAPIRPSQSGDRSADPIAAHPAIRRTLSVLSAMTEGTRVLSYWTAQLLDEAAHHPDKTLRCKASDLAALLTPIVKAFVTDCGHRGADEALQVWGGYGYLHDFGIEQTVRDSRITLIYEGTNEIQAIDLLVRKVLEDRGYRLRILAEHLTDTVNRCGSDELSALCARTLARQIDSMRKATDALVTGHAADPEWPYRVADDYLLAMGYVLLGWAWTKTICAVQSQASSEWHARKLSIARFGIEWLTPQADVHWQRVMTRSAALPEFGTDAS